MARELKEPPTYSFGRRDRGGLLIGFRASQLVLLGLGFAAVLAGLLLAGQQGGLIGFAVLTAFATMAIFPVNGQPAVDWGRPVANQSPERLRSSASADPRPTAALLVVTYRPHTWAAACTS
jgi:membrane protein implicated in regulation of membrane protease activity